MSTRVASRAATADLAIAAALWGGMYVVSAETFAAIPPATLGLLRLLLGVGALATFALLRGESLGWAKAPKGAVLRASLDAVERLGMPFLGETKARAKDEKAGLPDHLFEAPHGLTGGTGALQAAIDAARKAASEHEDHALNRTRTPVKGEGDDLW